MWPSHARIASLIQAGIDYDSALNMTPLDADRFLAIRASWTIPEDERYRVIHLTDEEAAAMADEIL